MVRRSDEKRNAPTPPERLRALARATRSASANYEPRTALMLATGRTSVTQALADRLEVDTSALPGSGPSVLPEDPNLTFGSLDGREVVVFGPLASPAEGAEPFEASLPIRLVRELGCTRIVIAVAGAALVETVAPGEVVTIRDHADASGVAALSTPNGPWPELGARFPDMSHAYDDALGDVQNTSVVAASIAGPALPTPTEASALRTMWRADVVTVGLAGWTTVARQAGLRVTALAGIVTSLAGEHARKPSSIEQMILAADSAAPKLTASILSILAASGQDAID